MTRDERKKHRREVLEGAAAELASHPDNGSGWLYADAFDGGAPLSDEAEEYRIAVLETLVAEIRRKAAK